MLKNIVNYAMDKAPEKIGKKFVPIYGAISTGKDIYDWIKFLAELGSIFDEKYNEAKYRYDHNQIGEIYDKYYIGAQR